MTNKPMLSVELRAGLERLLENGYAQYLTKIDAVELRVLLDAPAKHAESFEEWAGRELGLPIHRIASGDYQSFGMACAERAWNARHDAKCKGEPTAEQLEAVCQAYMKADGIFLMHPSSMWYAYKAMRALEKPAPVAVMRDALEQSQTDLQEGRTVSVEQLRDNLAAKFIGKKP